MRPAPLWSLLLPMLLVSDAACATVRIRIDLGRQRMYVASAAGDYVWRVSTARRGYRTPRGVFSAKSLEPMHYSSKYENAPMPHSIFFAGGYAIHGTYATASLGRPVSHGCVRLSPGHAAQLYHMVQRDGARISIVGGRR